MGRRTDRLGEQFRQEISKLLQTEIKDPRIGFVTLSRVDVADDLSQARVWTSVMGSDKEKKDSLIGLNQSASYIRKLLFRSMKIRKLPRFEFVLDENLDHSFRIQEMLHDLNESGEMNTGKKPTEGTDDEGKE